MSKFNFSTTWTGLAGVAICLLGMEPRAWPQQPAKRVAPKTAKAGEPKFKAIWEPVNVKEDLELVSIHFVSPEEGWVSGGKRDGGGGVILHTKDAGANWETQLGDLQSSDRPYTLLQFVAPGRGFAVQTTGVGDHKLLRTDDGQNWAPVGTVKQHRGDYRFTSPDTGFVVASDVIWRTQDGGKQWKAVHQCKANVEVKGLARNLPCHFDKLDFPTPSVGYAMSEGLPDGAGTVLGKTEDGGATWQTWIILPGENGREGSVRFTDPNNGAVRVSGAKMFHTADGGKTWTGASGTAPGGKPPIQFADGNVGWMIHYNTMGYTTDGGKNWISRNIAFPAPVSAFSLVRRDSGYVAGDHGMVYRYRIVPIDYTSKGMLDAPAMTSK